MPLIVHIADAKDWAAARAAGAYRPASLESEGFIHCSTLDQAVATADRYYRGVPGLVLLCIDEARLRAPCRYEGPAGDPSDDRPDERFPHVYGPLNLDAVVEALDFPCGEAGRFQLPAGVASRASLA